MKLYFARPVHFTAGAGNPAGSRGVKSNDAAVMNGVSHFLFVVSYPPPSGRSPPSGGQQDAEKSGRSGDHSSGESTVLSGSRDICINPA